MRMSAQTIFVVRNQRVVPKKANRRLEACVVGYLLDVAVGVVGRSKEQVVENLEQRWLLVLHFVSF